MNARSIEFMNTESITQQRLAWSLAEVATSLGLSPGFVRKQLRKGSLPSQKIGRRLLILDEDLRAWLGASSTADQEPLEAGR